MEYIFLFLVAFFSGLGFMPLVRKISLRHKLLISSKVPLIGGPVIYLSLITAYLCGLCFFKFYSKGINAILLGGMAMLVFGVIDDLRELSVVAKFLVQAVATALLIFFGIRTQIVYIGNALNMAITFIWVIGIANAFNHLDILDGLSAGTALIVTLALTVIALLNHDLNTVILTSALIGSLLGFLVYNLPPAKVYLGNSGSHFLGFVLAAIAFVISYAPLERKIALLSPLVIFGLPILDTLFLIFVRLKKKKLPFKKTNDHLAMRFAVLGYSTRKTLSVLLGFCLFFSFCGVFLSRVSNLLGTTIIILVLIVTRLFFNRVIKVVTK
jgi:UDP-GlcNAc:undecaprenyl-phosphate GlcNAc-1-phosphate transferase